MKMLGFVIALGVLYWAASTYAQSMIVAAAPCPVTPQTASVNVANLDAPRTEVAKLTGRWSEGEDYQLVLSPAGETSSGLRACAG